MQIPHTPIELATTENLIGRDLFWEASRGLQGVAAASESLSLR